MTAPIIGRSLAPSSDAGKVRDTRLTGPSLLRRALLQEHVDDDVLHYLSMTPDLSDIVIKQAVRVVADDLATARERHRITADLVFRIHIHSTSDPHGRRISVRCAQLVVVAHDVGVCRHRSPGQRVRPARWMAEIT